MEGVQKCGYLEVKEPSCIKGRKLKVLNFMSFMKFYCMHLKKKKELSYIQIDQFKITIDLSIAS